MDFSCLGKAANSITDSGSPSAGTWLILYLLEQFFIFLSEQLCIFCDLES